MDPLSIRMAIKALIKEARSQGPEHYEHFEFIGEVDEVDIAIEALIRPDLFEIAVRNKEA